MRKSLQISEKLSLPLEAVTKALGVALTTAEIKRFFDKFTQPESGCWLWLGEKATKQRGPAYGRFAIYHSNHRIVFYAHRLAYLFHYGTLPESLICHRCDNPPCVRPDHLFPGTHMENMSDMVAKGRAPRPPVYRGEDHHKATLTSEQVKAVLALLATGTPQRVIANEFGVSQSTIWRIGHGVTRAAG